MKSFLQSLLSRKLIGSAAVIGWVNNITGLSPKWKGILTVVVTVGYGILNVLEKVVAPPVLAPALPGFTPAADLPASPAGAPQA